MKSVLCKNLVGAVAVAAILSGCAALKPAEAPRATFELSTPGGVSTVPGRTPAQILVKAPTSLSSLDSNRIVVRTADDTVTYLAGAQWIDTLPRMMQAKLVAAFENSGKTGATAEPGDGLVIDYQIIPVLREFGIASDQRTATVELSVKLLSDRTGKVVRTRIFKATSVATGTGPDAYVSALDRAFGDLTLDLVAWVLRTV